MGEIAVNQNSTIILPVPIDLFKPFLESQNGASTYGQEVRAARLEEEKEAGRLSYGDARRRSQPLARKGHWCSELGCQPFRRAYGLDARSPRVEHGARAG